jgi:hypothetical protein
VAENKTKFLPGWAQGNDFKYNFDFYPKWFDSRNEKTWQRWKVGIYMYAWWEQKIPFPPEVISAWKILMRSEESVNIVQDENLQKEFISKLNTIFSTKKFRFKTKIIDKTKFNINNPESSINYLSLWKNEILVSEDWHSSYQQDCPERMEAKSHGADYFEDVLVEPK